MTSRTRALLGGQFDESETSPDLSQQLCDLLFHLRLLPDDDRPATRWIDPSPGGSQLVGSTRRGKLWASSSAQSSRCRSSDRSNKPARAEAEGPSAVCRLPSGAAAVRVEGFCNCIATRGGDPAQLSAFSACQMPLCDSGGGLAHPLGDLLARHQQPQLQFPPTHRRPNCLRYFTVPWGRRFQTQGVQYGAHRADGNTRRASRTGLTKRRKDKPIFALRRQRQVVQPAV